MSKDKDSGGYYGEGFEKISEEFHQADGRSPAETWSKLASYWKERGFSDEAQWCMLRAQGKSWKEAYDIAYAYRLPPSEQKSKNQSPLMER